MLSRRRFLGGTAAAASWVALSPGTPPLLVRAADAAAKSGRSDRVLVVLELAGGNDGLNTLVPFEDAAYYRRRPTLAIRKADVHRLSDTLGLHPSLKALAERFRQGELAVVQGVGYPQPDRSHFRSLEIWHTASTNAQAPPTGWLGRYLDTLRAGGLPALVLGAPRPQALAATKTSAFDVDQLESIEAAAGGSNSRSKLVRRLSSRAPGEAEPATAVARQARAMYAAADQLRAAADKYRSTIEYPDTELGRRLRKVAQLLSADRGTRIVFVSQDGYDTHSAQADQHAARLEEFSAALDSLLRDLAALDLADKVAVMVYSEFGRRVEQNASGGTDHGAASCMFLAGKQVRGGFYGDMPSLEKLDDGDLVYSTDFRSVYATVLDGWLGCRAKPLLGDDFPELKLFA